MPRWSGRCLLPWQQDSSSRPTELTQNLTSSQNFPHDNGGSARSSRQLAAGGVDVAAAGEADGGAYPVLGEDCPEALDPLRRGAVVGAGRVVGDEIDLVGARVEQGGELAGMHGQVVDPVEHHVLDEDLATAAGPVALAGGQHLGQRI